MDPVNDFILWYSKSKREEGKTKFRTLYKDECSTKKRSMSFHG